MLKIGIKTKPSHAFNFQDSEDELDTKCSGDPEVNKDPETDIRSNNYNSTHLLERKQLYVDLANNNLFAGYDHTVGRCNKSSESIKEQELNNEKIKSETITEEAENYSHLGRKQLYIDLANSNIIDGYGQTAGIHNKSHNVSYFEHQMRCALFVELINWDFHDRLEDVKQENLDLLVNSNGDGEEMLKYEINVKKQLPFPIFQSDGWIKHIRKIKNIDKILECKIEKPNKTIESNVEKQKKDKYFDQKSAKKVEKKKKDASASSKNYSVFTPITNYKYQCDICRHNFAEKQMSEDHTALHIPRGKNVDGRKMYNCAFCPYKPNYISHLRNHTKVQHTPQDEMEIFTCKTCGYKTPDINSMRDHIKIHKDPSKCEKFRCDQCSFETRYKFGITSHKKHKHGEKHTIFKCQQCSYQSHIQDYLKSHIKSQHKPPEEQITYKCNDCAFETRTKSSLPAHMLLHKRQDKIEWWKCPECPFKTIHKGNLSKHYLIKHEVSEYANKFRTRFKCPHCDYKCYRKIDFSGHLVTHKSKEEIDWHHCGKCPFKGKTHSALDAHCYHKHTSDDKVKWFFCNICTFKSKYKSGIEKHALTHKSIYEVSDTYSCHLCIYQAKTKDLLRFHLKQHMPMAEVKKFECPDCTYKTRYSGHLKVHMIVHNPEKFEFFNCKECSFKTRIKCNLNAHFRRKHSNEAVWFTCGKCSYKSTCKGSLKLHLLLHRKSSEIDWFNCAHCFCKTKYKSHLIIHFRNHPNHKFSFCSAVTRGVRPVSPHRAP